MGGYRVVTSLYRASALMAPTLWAPMNLRLTHYSREG